MEPSIVQYVKQNNIDIIEQEFISVQPVFPEEKFKQLIDLTNSEIRHVIFTSSNAVTALNDLLNKNNTISTNNWKIFCLSGKTKEAIINSIFPKENIVSVADNAAALAKKIIDEKIKEVIFFCGNKRRDELPSLLKNAGIKIHEIIVYETVETPTIATDEFKAVLFFSPSAVQSFFSLNQLKKDIICFAIGDSTADSIAGFSNNKIITCRYPSQEEMINSVQNYFAKINCYE